jgi:hypothetical protein
MIRPCLLKREKKNCNGKQIQEPSLQSSELEYYVLRGGAGRNPRLVPLTKALKALGAGGIISIAAGE